MNHLNQGLRTTAISDTDTHTFGNLETRRRAHLDGVVDRRGRGDRRRRGGGRGGRRTRGRRAGHLRADAPARDRRLGRRGRPHARRQHRRHDAPNGNVNLEIHVQAPRWARFDRIEVYANATTACRSIRGAPYLYTRGRRASPSTKGDCDPATTGDGDFDISTVNVAPGVPGGTAPGGDADGAVHRAHRRHLVRGGGEGHGRRVRADVPGLPAQPRRPPATRRSRTCSTGTSARAARWRSASPTRSIAEVNGVPGFQPLNP